MWLYAYAAFAVVIGLRFWLPHTNTHTCIYKYGHSHRLKMDWIAWKREKWIANYEHLKSKNEWYNFSDDILSLLPNVEKPLCYLNVHKNDMRQYGIICDMIFYDYFIFFALLFLFDDPISFQGCTDEISFLLYNELHQMLLKLLR